MNEVTPQTEPLLTEEQQKEVNEVFLFRDEYEVTEEDVARLSEIFSEPGDFLLLRKILGIHTPNEAGLTYKSPHKLLEASLADREAYAIEHAVSMMADERIRNGLLQTYVQIREFRKQNLTEKFETKNQEEFEEGKRTEEFEEEQDLENRDVSEQL